MSETTYLLLNVIDNESEVEIPLYVINFSIKSNDVKLYSTY